ncbi:MFS transporter [Rhodococcus qingshengii]|uniref:MFS transporter n=1 Tax=Rhodococcus qingshengii TaxID=334542 RepID=UPI001BEA03A8|nr:MFS transporter [Rhodococcus qingshengii]MBT2274814.1 MFS transporter [Rhodococcus qingshengii]
MSTTNDMEPTSTSLQRESATTRKVDRRRYVVLATMCAGMFLVQLDVTIVNVALPHIGDGLQADLAGLQWVVDGYAVVLASLLLAGGTLGDRFGHKRVVVAGLTVFGLASVACALAPTSGGLIAARAFQGVGAALLLPGTLAVITQTFPNRGEQARAVGIWAGASALALPAGPFVGGLLVTAWGWRSVFWINVPIVVLAIVAAALVVRESTERTPRPLDVLGVGTAAVALSATVFAVIRAGSDGLDGTLALAAGVAVIAIALFLIVERRAGDDAMLPLTLMRSRAFAAANAIAAAMNSVGIGTIFVSTLYLQGVQGKSPLTAAALMLPLFLPVAVLSPIAGRMNSRVGPIPPMLTGLICGAIGGLNMLRLQPDSSYLTVAPTLAGIGIGMGMLAAPVVAAAMRSVPPERSGVASAANNTARQAAGALGIAVFGAVASSPSAAERFVDGMHVNGLIAATTWTAAALVAVAALRGLRPVP